MKPLAVAATTSSEATASGITEVATGATEAVTGTGVDAKGGTTKPGMPGFFYSESEAAPKDGLELNATWEAN